MPFVRPALLALALVACSPLPDTGADPSKAGPPPPLVPLDGLLAEPEPQATVDVGKALAERGAALKAEAKAMK